MSSPSQAIRITAEQVQAKLTPAQKKFNSLIKQIDTQRKRLSEWQDTLSRCQQEALTRLEPLRKTLGEHQAERAQLLDRQFNSHKFTRKEQEKLTYLICETCDELITQHGRDDLKPLYNRYSAEDFDTQEQDSQALASELFKDLMEGLGIDPGDEDFEFDPRDPQASAAWLGEKFKDRQAQAGAAHRPSRKKTAKQLAKEAREREEAAQVSKSIQAVYRQLVAALHPDREPDPDQRARKTELMQAVTVAYGDRDLLRLLELQLAIEQIDQNRLNNLAEDRLKHYNKVLQNQYVELRDEVLLMEVQVREQLQVAPYGSLTPKRVARMLKDDIRTLEYKNELRRFQDPHQLKQWLNVYRIPEPDFDPFSGLPPFGFG
ncbi:MAG: molecular chaperone DnaJ [Gammaproteobacteria bacterium]